MIQRPRPMYGHAVSATKAEIAQRMSRIQKSTMRNMGEQCLSSRPPAMGSIPAV